MSAVKWTEKALYPLAALMAAAILLIDLSLPLGVAMGVPYVGVVLLGWWLPRRGSIFLLAGATSLLVALGYLASHEGGIPWMVAANRLLALFSIWVTAGLLWFAKKGEETRRDRESLLTSIMDSAVDAIITIDEYGIVLSFNGSAEEMFGYASSEIVGRNVSTLMTAPVARDHDGHLARYLRTREARVVGSLRELTALRKSGEEFPINLSLSETQAGGRPVFTGVVRDTTRRIRAQEAQRKYTSNLESLNRELVRAKMSLERTLVEVELRNKELDEFTYFASHDLQEPLRKITSFGELLKVDLGENLPEDAEKDLELMIDGAMRMRNLIQDLLALSRAGKSEIHGKGFDLNKCVDSALDSLAVRIGETGAEIARDDLPEVWGDPTLLAQVYQNLIGNALKFLNASPPRIHLTAEAEDGLQVLGVRDNGIGMDPKYAEKIFEPFKRLHGQSKYGGSGVGLAIAQKFVILHGGRIWAESELGAGSHFKFILGNNTTANQQTQHERIEQ
jgi:PAS domain S-box-containing protein